MKTRIVSQRTSDFAHSVSNHFNYYGVDDIGLAKILAGQHRALIDYMVKAVITFLIKLSDDYQNKRFDARDAKAVEKASLMIQALKENNLLSDWTIKDTIEECDNTFDCPRK